MRATAATGEERLDAQKLYAVTYPRLVRVLSAAAGRPTAEDVVQEAFVRLLTSWPKVSRYDDPEAWVRAVAFRLLSSRQRRARRRARLIHTHLPPAAADDLGGTAIDVERALAALPPSQRQVIILHHLCDLPVERVAADLRVPVGTVKSRLSRARAALAPLLDEEAPHA